MSDAINPDHYKHLGVEAIEVVEWLSFNLGNAVKYLWRVGLKGPPHEDLRKSLWYFRRELERLRQLGAYGSPRPRTATDAALRALPHCDTGVLRLVLDALFTTSGDYVTVLQLLEATAYVQQALDAENSFTATFTPREVEPESVDPRETAARMEAAASAHAQPGAGTITPARAR